MASADSFPGLKSLKRFENSEVFGSRWVSKGRVVLMQHMSMYTWCYMRTCCRRTSPSSKSSVSEQKEICTCMFWFLVTSSSVCWTSHRANHPCHSSNAFAVPAFPWSIRSAVSWWDSNVVQLYNKFLAVTVPQAFLVFEMIAVPLPSKMHGVGAYHVMPDYQSVQMLSENKLTF